MCAVCAVGPSACGWTAPFPLSRIIRGNFSRLNSVARRQGPLLAHRCRPTRQPLPPPSIGYSILGGRSKFAPNDAPATVWLTIRTTPCSAPDITTITPPPGSARRRQWRSDHPIGIRCGWAFLAFGSVSVSTPSSSCALIPSRLILLDSPKDRVSSRRCPSPRPRDTHPRRRHFQKGAPRLCGIVGANSPARARSCNSQGVAPALRAATNLSGSLAARRVREVMPAVLTGLNPTFALQKRGKSLCTSNPRSRALERGVTTSARTLRLARMRRVQDTGTSSRASAQGSKISFCFIRGTVKSMNALNFSGTSRPLG